MASGHSGHPSGERIWKQLKKTIVPGNYIKLSEQESLYKELKLHFNDFIACLKSDIPGHVQRRYLFLYPVCAEIQEPDHCVLYENSCRSLTNPQKQIKEKYGGRNLPNHLQ